MESPTRPPEGRAIVILSHTAVPDLVAAVVVGPMDRAEAERWVAVLSRGLSDGAEREQPTGEERGTRST